MRYLWLSLIMLSGCTSVHYLGDDHYAVPRAVEVRSPFGTNVGFVKLDDCVGVKDPRTTEITYHDCQPIKDWEATSSQGQGGQIVGGALTGLGFGLGNAFAPAGGSSANAAQSQSVLVPAAKGHH